jgi:transcriptional regulator with XRE-family HTH domain
LPSDFAALFASFALLFSPYRIILPEITLTLIDNMDNFNHIGNDNPVNVVDKINILIADRGMSKAEFAKALIDLQPRLNSTGEIPAKPSIYHYLNGQRELKVELIPYIARVLETSETELFSEDVENAFGADTALSKEGREIMRLLPYAPAAVIRNIKEQLERYKKLYGEFRV